MKKTILFALLLALVLFPLATSAIVHVNGYYRANGTYVAPHYRSDPNGTPTDNWSYPGNTNPMTGVTATGNVDTYLRDHGYTTPSLPSYTPTYTPPITTCPINAYLGTDGSCYCNAGYSASGSICITSNQACQNLNGINSYAIGSKCYCNSGYLFSGGQCVTDLVVCQNNFGVNSYAVNGQCGCNSGYQWNSDKTACVVDPEITDDNSALIQKLLQQIADLQKQINAILAQQGLIK